MKIYNKIVINMATNEVLEEDSFEYHGPIAYCKGDTSYHAAPVEAPKPTAQETALQQQQLKILQTQQSEAAQMKPFVLQGMGLVEEGGALRQMTEAERLSGMSELEKGQYDLTRLSQERQAQAYAGELPISPALENELSTQKAQMQEALSQRLGPDWMLTTPGQQAWSAFNQKADLVREESRRGAISSEGGLLLSNLGYLGNTDASRASMAGQYPGRTSGMFGGYGILQQPYQQQRGMEFQAGLTNAASTNQARMFEQQMKHETTQSDKSKAFGILTGSTRQGYSGY